MIPQAEQEKKTPTPREAIFVILGSFFFSILPQLLVIWFFPGTEEGSVNPLGLKISLVAGELSMAIIPIVYLKMHNFSLPQIFRWRKVPANILWLSVPVGLGLSIIVDEIDRLLQMIIPMPEELSSELIKVMQINSGIEFLLVVLSAVILAAIVEEAIFRGFLQGAIENHINVTQAVIYGSLAWAAIHLNPYIAIQLFLFGFVIGYLTWRAGSIIPAIICHAINNTMAILYYNVDFSEKFPLYEWGEHVSPIILAICALVVFKGIQYIDQYYRSLRPPSASSASSE